MDRGRNGRNAETRYGEGIRNRRARQRAFLIGATPDEPDLSELRELLRTAGVAVAGEMVQRRDRPDPDRYFGRGKLDEVKAAVKETGANLVACDDELLPRQERNLEQELDVPVIDRTAIILDIFADHAGSAEGKLQVELAQLEYNLARMRGPLDAPRAAGSGTHGRRHRHPRTGRVPDRDGPPAGARPHLRSCAAACATPRPRAARCARSASAPAFPPWRSPATRTPASPRC